MKSTVSITPAESPVKLAFNVKEAAEALGVSRDTIYRLIYTDKDFPAHRLNSRFLIPIRGLEEWVNRRNLQC